MACFKMIYFKQKKGSQNYSAIFGETPDVNSHFLEYFELLQMAQSEPVVCSSALSCIYEVLLIENTSEHGSLISTVYQQRHVISQMLKDVASTRLLPSAEGVQRTVNAQVVSARTALHSSFVKLLLNFVNHIGLDFIFKSTSQINDILISVLAIFIEPARDGYHCFDLKAAYNAGVILSLMIKREEFNADYNIFELLV